ncbi:MAG: hypothetical protein OES09_11255 [Gammaproteobacteria bacterium]|nr:hypothetical protein [Gammaproteobacteria bacterium]
MAKTLLNSVNEILKRTGIITGDASALTSLTDSPRQRAVDVSVQVVNEGIEEVYSAGNASLPSEQAESTITLAASDRDYTLATDLVQLRFPLIDKTNNQFITQYPGGYNQILVDDPEQDDTGLPHFAAIRPTDGLLYLDRAPTSVEAGRIYTYQYDKDISLSVATDTVPFSDAAFRAMVPAWVQLWKREMRNEFDGELFEASIGRAARLLPQTQPRDSYNPR